MKIFLSWSGELSHKVALVLRDWLPSVIQFVEPYVSSEDIDKGARWSTDIAAELEASSYGILCVTADNTESPWLNFEAGALSKAIDKARVSPFIVGLKRSEVKAGPILQFQSTIPERNDVLKLLQSINGAGKQPLDSVRLDTIFAVWWPQLESNLAQLEASSKTLPQVSNISKSDEHSAEILEEMLELLRQQNRVINSPMDLLPPTYLREFVTKQDESRDHPAYRDLEDAWMRVKELNAELIEGRNVPKDVIADVILGMRSPIEYILRKHGRNPRRSPRSLRDLRMFMDEKSDGK
jgi:TIR domain